MMMPFDSASSRAMVTGVPLLLGPSPEMSMTRRRPLIRALVEQRHREIDRAGDRRARGAADRRLQDLGGHGIGAFGPVDDAPGDDDLLVGRGGPFEIGHGHLAVRTGLQRLQEILRHDRLRIAFALDRKLVHVHGIGDVDGENRAGRRPHWHRSRHAAARLAGREPHRRQRRHWPSVKPQAQPRSRQTSASADLRNRECPFPKFVLHLPHYRPRTSESKGTSKYSQCRFDLNPDGSFRGRRRDFKSAAQRS